MEYAFTYDEVSKAFDECLKHKKNTKGAKEFLLNKVSNLILLTDEINSRTYTIGISEAFVITDPKIREVFAANFRDRIIHHLVVRELEPYFEKYFIKDTYSCMKGRGTLHGVQALEKKIREYSENYTKPLYLLKMDYMSFFMSIDKALLRDRLDAFIVENYPDNRKKECLRWLCSLIVMHHPEENCIKKGSPRLWKKLPKHKNLFYVPKTKGLAIGNLTSQMFANFYLTPMDWFIIMVLKLLFHVRYADDFVDGHDDLEYLKKCIPLIKGFAETNLLLTIHPDKIYIQECHKGVQFVGANIKPFRIYCGNRALSKFFKALNVKYFNYDEKLLDAYVSSVNSYLGLTRHYKTYKIRKKYLNEYTRDWKKSITINKGYTKINKQTSIGQGFGR